MSKIIIMSKTIFLSGWNFCEIQILWTKRVIVLRERVGVYIWADSPPRVNKCGYRTQRSLPYWTELYKLCTIKCVQYNFKCIKLFVLEIKVAKISKSTKNCGCDNKNWCHAMTQFQFWSLRRLIVKSANSSCFCWQ